MSSEKTDFTQGSILNKLSALQLYMLEFAESKFAHAMDNLQPLILNNSNGGADWREHKVTSKQVYGRQIKTKVGSERLYEVTDKIIQENIKKGNIKE